MELHYWGEMSREPGTQWSPVNVRVAPALGWERGSAKEPVLRAFPGWGTWSTPGAVIRPISKLCSLRPREVQGLGLKYGELESDQEHLVPLPQASPRTACRPQA